MKIPYRMVHIWIGPNPAPLKWMNTWKEKHPRWNYRLFDNDWLAKTTFETRHIIDAYIERGKYAGAADCIRYELLYRYGGFIPPADAICHHNTEELFHLDEDYCYSVYENEEKRPGFISPIYACNPGNAFVREIIWELRKLRPEQLREPWKTTGNEFLANFIKKKKPKIHIFPSYTFIPLHYSSGSVRYSGPNKVYSDQMWGSTGVGNSVHYSEGL